MLRLRPNRMVSVVAAVALARSLYHLIDRHRVDEAAGFLATDLQSDFRAEATAWLAAFPDLRVSVRRVVAAGDHAVAWLGLRGTHQARFAGVSATGRSMQIEGVDLLVERDGRIVQIWSLRDLNALWMQFGVLPHV